MRYFNHKGLSQPVILVLVLVAIAIFTFVAGKFVEQSRATEAENLINLVASAQKRHQMNKGKFSTTWKPLDIGMISSHMNRVGQYISPDGTTYLTKGGGFENPNKGFKMYFQTVRGKFYVIAERIHWRYEYTLVRPVSEDKTYCLPSTGLKAKADEKLCKEFMGVDELPQDPRTLTSKTRNSWW